LLVTNHVSQPYSRTDFTHALNSLILRGRLMFFALHTFFSLEKKKMAGWRPEISELGRDRDFQFFAIDSVDYGGPTIIKILNQAPLCVPGAKL
jgi:hypothetical protein